MKQDETVVDVALGGLTPEHLQQLGAVADSSPLTVKQALLPLVAVVVRALADRATRPHGPDAIWDLTQQAHNTQALAQLDTLNIASWRGRGVLLLQGLLNDTYETTTYRLATKAGLPLSSYALLVEVAVALVLGTLGQYAAEQQLTPARLSAWLQENPAAPLPPPTRPGAMAAGPAAPLRAASAGAGQGGRQVAAGAGTWAPVGGGSIFTPQRPRAARLNLAKLKQWQWALGLVPVLLLGYVLLRWILPTAQPAATQPSTPVAYTTNTKPDAPPVTTAAELPPGRYDAATDTYIYNTGQPLIITLADGSTQRVGMNSTEYQLYQFLADTSRPVDSLNPAAGWINVDRVYFKSGEATLATESQRQLRNLAAILRTFPKARIMFGGYSDSVGNGLRNLRLSDDRAQVARRALAEQGISMERLQAIGYGEAYAVASNAGPVGRALNRRLSIKVLTKNGPVLSEPEPAPVAPNKPATLAAPTARRPHQTRKRSKVGRWINNMRQRLRNK